MKKYLTILNLIILTVLSLSCSDFLEQEPGPQVSIEEQLATTAGVKMALTGTYGSLESLLRSENFATYGDLQSGNLSFSPTPSGSNRGQISVPVNIENSYNFADRADDSDFESFYDDAYDVINQANLILENAESLEDATNGQISEIMAEAYAVRGFTHYLLLRVYAQALNNPLSDLGIVYKTSTLKEELDYPERLSISESMEKVIMDLELARSSFTGSQALEGPEYSYFNKINAEALLSKVYLSVNQYDKSIELAQEVLNNSAVSLMTTEEYLSEWEKFSTPVSEILLELVPPRDQEGDLGGSLQQYYGFNETSIYGDYVASQDLLSLYEDGDVRGAPLYIEADLPTVVEGQLQEETYYFSRKFQGEPGIPVIRLSEMYLIQAEAFFQKGNLVEALHSLNIIRERAGINPLQETEGLLEEILLERRREFAFENQYFFDLKRIGKGVVRMECIATTCNLDYPSPYFVLPIPQKNINLNENLQQNEGY